MARSGNIQLLRVNFRGPPGSAHVSVASAYCRPASRGARSGCDTSRRSNMIKVSVMYPNTPGARFDHAYYRDKHMPLVQARMGKSCTHYTVDKGLAGGAPSAPAPFVAM